MAHDAEREQTAYVFALSHLASVGQSASRKLLEIFPSAASWQTLDDHSSDLLSRILRNKRSTVLSLNWDTLLERASEEIEFHQRMGIRTISIKDKAYPPLLRLIENPPSILFVKGNEGACTDLPGIAVIGTRNATPFGEKVAKRIARYFSEHAFSIISGLAKGIDAAAHVGAVEAFKTTVAVFATPLDKIYPAENRQLAYSILDSGGAWVSEIPLDRATHRNTFVERDRIQSGLSSAVIPVQTDVQGGTMHTVGFAEKQDRLLFCPAPIQQESYRDQYRGIQMLISSGRAKPFTHDDYPKLADEIMSHFSLLKERSKGSNEPFAPVDSHRSQGALTFSGAGLSVSKSRTSALVQQALASLKQDLRGKSRQEIRAVLDYIESELLAGSSGT